MIRRPPRSTQSRSSAASDVYKRQVRARGARLQTGLLLFVTAIIVAGSFAVAVANAIQLVPGSYFSSFGRFWEMGVGALLAIAAPSLQSLQTPRNRAPLVAIGLGAILVAAVSYGAQTPFPGYAALVPVLGTAMIIVFGANSSASAEPRSIDLLACCLLYTSPSPRDRG